MSNALQESTATEFNRRVTVGETVRFWCGARDGAGMLGHTVSLAWTLGGHTPSVRIRSSDGKTRTIALSHVERHPVT